MLARLYTWSQGCLGSSLGQTHDVDEGAMGQEKLVVVFENDVARIA